MARRRSLWRRLIVVGLVIMSLAMLTLFFREQTGGALHGAQRSGARVLQPLESGASVAIRPFRNAWNWVGDLFTAKSDNSHLRKEVIDLRKALAAALAGADESQQLRGLLSMKQNSVYPKGVKFIPARVIGRSTQVWYSTVTINVGSTSGVRLMDAVVNGEGLVGRISQVTANAAEVTLITDQDSYVDAKVVPGGAQGLVAGSVTGNVSMEYVDKSQKVQAGQYILTSGMTGSIFVPNIPIGVVENVGHQDVELYQSVTVRPLVDFHKLDYVMVVQK